MIIKTNISDTEFVHDTIQYPPIERQVFEFFTKSFVVKHEMDRGTFILILDGFRIALDIPKKGKNRGKGVYLGVLAPSPYEGGIRFGEKEYPTLKLPFNKDVEKKVLAFGESLRKIEDLEKRARALPAVADAKTVTAALTEQVAIEGLTVSYWNENLFSGIEIVFYIHPVGKAPADGLLFCIDGGKLVPFWNGSTPRRKAHYGSPEVIERAAGHDLPTDMAAMKKRIEIIERLQTRLDAFDPAKSPQLAHLLQVKKQADALVMEFNDVLGR